MKKIILFLISVILFSSLATALTFPYHIDFEEGDFSDVTGSQFNISTSDCMGSYCAYIDRNSQIMYVELGAFDVYTIECYFYIRDMTTQEFSFLTATTGTTTYANLNYIVPLSKSNYGALHNISFYQGAWFYGITPDYPENEWFPVRVFYNDTSNNRTLWYNNTKYFSSTGGSTNGDIGSLIFNTRDSASLNLSVDNCTIWRDLVPPPTELAPVLNVYFSNSTYDNNKTNFQESENFFIYFNWS